MLLSCLLLVTAQVDPSRAVVPLGGDYWQGTDVKPGEVWGVADLHAHYFNYLGFGGRVLHGTPSAPNGIRQALRSCRSNHGEDARGMSTAVLPEPAHRTSGYPDFEGWPRYDTSVHQQAYVDWIRRAWHPVISSHADFRDLSFGTRWRDGGVEVNPVPFADDSAGSYGTSDALKVRTERSRTPEQLAIIRRPPLFRSAELYLQMWERLEGRALTLPR